MKSALVSLSLGPLVNIWELLGASMQMNAVWSEPIQSSKGEDNCCY